MNMLTMACQARNPWASAQQASSWLQHAEAGRFTCVLVYRLTRLGRSLKALIEAHDMLARHSVTISSAMELFDTSTPVGSFIFQMMSSLAELDRAQMLDQLTRGRDRVARQGKWTNGLVPYGYMVNAEGLLIPSERQVEAVGMTEADVVRDLYQRIAAGSSAVGESQQLNALGVPTTRYYGRGTPREGTKWHPGPVARLIASEMYKGMPILKSRHGRIEREVPALVDPELWAQANAQLQRNRHLPKSNATRTYLLRGLITCGSCDSNYLGQVSHVGNRPPIFYYRCGGRHLTHYPNRTERYPSRTIRAAWIEQIVWEDCRNFIRNPGEALAKAQEQLHARQQQVPTMEQERTTCLRALAEKGQERDRVMTMFQRGRLPRRMLKPAWTPLPRKRRPCASSVLPWTPRRPWSKRQKRIWKTPSAYSNNFKDVLPTLGSVTIRSPSDRWLSVWYMGFASIRMRRNRCGSPLPTPALLSV
jgi:site-specific DNA recombinase